MDQNKETVVIQGGFYTVITIHIDLLESRIIDERHFGTEEEAKAFQMRTIIDNQNKDIHCFIYHLGRV